MARAFGERRRPTPAVPAAEPEPLLTPDPAAELPAYPDPVLRRWGFRVAARPNGAPALWQDVRTHAVMTVEQAYKIVLLRMGEMRERATQTKAAEPKGGL